MCFSSCNGNNNSGETESESSGGTESESESSGDTYVKYDYTATHDAADNILLFKSSDSGLDSFLNEFFERHSRYSENRIHTHPVGAGGTAWKEWESLIGSWWDSSYAFNSTISNTYATKDYVERWLLSPQQDRQGYVWCDDGNTPSSWGMGWAFPTYSQTPNVCCGYEFDNSIDGWTSPSGALVGLTDTLLPSDSSKELTAAQNNANEISIESPDILITSFYSPFMSMGLSFDNIGNADNLDDLYVYYQTKTDGNYTEDKMVKFSELCTTGFSINGSIPYDGYYLPMYLSEAWGQSTKNVITKFKIVLKAKEGTEISGNLRFDFIRCDYDDRQANNCGEYITAAASLLSYAQDPNLLNYIMPKARAAMQHYLTELDGVNGLMSTEYYVGHDGQGVVEVGTGIGDGYWDVTSYPDVNLYTNLVFYRSVKAMAYLENLCNTYGINPEMPTIFGKDMKTEIKYSETAQTLEAMQTAVKEKFEDYFWDGDKGRFIAGYYGGVKDKDNIQDNGYLQFNLEAVSAGLGTDKQQSEIMAWINGDRIIAGDNAQGADIYKFEFAPRNTTKQNIGDYCFLYAGCNWEAGVHNGGAVMQSSYYDLISRVKVLGADNAYIRLKAIEKWYEKVKSYGGIGWNFYHAYYDTTDIGMQGGSSGGAVGLDYEFLEAALMYASVPTAFFGINPSYDKTLEISPEMPSELDYWKLENLTYASYYYDVSISKYFVQISGVRNKDGSSSVISDQNIKVSIDAPEFGFDVYYNGAKINYELIGGKAVVTVPFTNGKVEIIGR